MSNKKVRVYLASQIFAECWRDYNEKLAQAIEEAYPEVELYVPQRNKSINDKTKCATAEQITYGDFTNNLDKDDIVVAIVDGDTPGIGTTLEIGYFSRICQEEIEKYGATKKKIISSKPRYKYNTIFLLFLQSFSLTSNFNNDRLFMY